MKRLLLPLLLAPSVAMAGLVIVEQPALVIAKQGTVPGVIQGSLVVSDVAQPPQWSIEKGQPIHIALDSWAKEAGWTFYWYPAKSWKAAGRADMSSQNDVSAAVAEVVSILREEGKAIKLRISEGNNVMEVFSTEVKND